MKKFLVEALAVIVIIFLAVAVSTSAKGDLALRYLSAVIFNGQSNRSADIKNGDQTASLSAASRIPDSQELYGIIRHLNSQIDAALVDAEPVPETPVARPSGGGSSSSGAPAPAPDPTPDPEPDAPPGDGGVGANVLSAISRTLARLIVPTNPKNFDTEAEQIKQTTNIHEAKEISGTPAVAPVRTLESLLTYRHSLMSLLAKADPRLFLLSKLSESTESKIPRSLRAKIEGSISVTGVIEVIHFDDFENHENSRFGYFLRVDDKKYNLHFVNPPTLASGGTFRITGIKIGLDIVVSDFVFDEDAVVIARGPDSTIGEQKTLALLLNFENSGTPLVTPQEFRSMLFSGPFQDFYKEQSFEKIHFSGEVSGWHTIPRSCGDGVGGWPDGPWGNNEVATIIQNQHIHLQNYDRLLLIIDCLNTTGGSGSVGKGIVSVGDEEYLMSVAWVGVSEESFQIPWGRNAPYQFSIFDFVVSHEVGHNLGVIHANGFDCGEYTLSDDCEHIEYGNYFDNMGFGFYGLHFNAFYKELFNWITPNKSVDINESGRYTIHALEDKNSPKQLAKVRVLDSTLRPFYLEFRNGLGFDSLLNLPHLASNKNGLFVNRIIHPGNGYPPSSRLLDMSPTNLGWYDDTERTTLNSSQVFSNPGTGITIGPIVSTSSTTISFDVQVEKPTCVRGNPIMDMWSPEFVIAGFEATAEIYFGNGDSFSCGNSNFRVETVDMPISWNPIMIPAGVTTLPSLDQPGFSIQGVRELHFQPSVETPLGEYDFDFRIRNLTSGRSTTNSNRPFHTTVIRQPHISYALPPRGQAGAHVYLYGSDLGSDPLFLFIEGAEGYQYMYDLSAANGIITEFNFPDQICSYSGEYCDLIETPAGVYNLVLFTHGFPSNTVTFEVTP